MNASGTDTTTSGAEVEASSAVPGPAGKTAATGAPEVTKPRPAGRSPVDAEGGALGGSPVPVRWQVLGVIGLLVAAMAAFGLAPLLLPDSYSWVEHGISESAAQGVEGSWPARLGFIAFGLAVVWLVPLRWPTWPPLASILHLVFGVSMFGVAAFSAKSWEEGAFHLEREDSLHSLFASVMGFAIIAALAALIVVRQRRSVWAALPDWIAFAVMGLVPLAMSSGVWGLLQRTMFVVAAVWYGREAWMVSHPGRRAAGIKSAGG